jgi:hypothetical protein
MLSRRDGNGFVGTASKKPLHGIAISTPDEETKKRPSAGAIALEAALMLAELMFT